MLILRHLDLNWCRSREGAWIEILVKSRTNKAGRSRSREGAWIEIQDVDAFRRVRLCRSREGAWIEIIGGDLAAGAGSVAPVRERGLKCLFLGDFGLMVLTSLP